MVIATAPILMRSDNLVCALFREFQSAQRAYKSLLDRGYRPEEINVVSSNESKKKYIGVVRKPFGNKSLKGAGLGSAIGLALGAVAAVILMIVHGSALVIPAIGLTVAGKLAAAFFGAGVGGLLGTLLGAAFGAGIREKRLKVITAHLNHGGIMITVRAHSERDAELLVREWRPAARIVQRAA